MSRSNVSAYASLADDLSSNAEDRRHQLKRTRPVVGWEGDVIAAEALAARKEDISKPMSELYININLAIFSKKHSLCNM